jgi:hypothetical protein
MARLYCANGLNSAACFGLAQLSRTEQGRSADGGTDGGLAGSGLPAVGSVKEWR